MSILADLIKAVEPVIDEENNRLLDDPIHRNYQITLTYWEYKTIKKLIKSIKKETQCDRTYFKD